MKGQAPVRIGIGALGFVAGVVPLVLALRIPGGRHEVLLAAFGPLIGWAFIGTWLRAKLEELQASRARIVETSDATRRRIERDLHDGAQQRLVSLAHTLRLARARVREEPERAQELLEAANRDLEVALAELRELARGIHPAVLSERGLDAALHALANRAPVPVELISTPNGRRTEDGRGTAVRATIPCA